MREGFISTTVEKSASGTPEAWIGALPPHEAVFRTLVRKQQGGDQIPEHAVHDAAQEVQAVTVTLRREGEEKAKRSIMELLRKRKRELVLPVALVTAWGVAIPTALRSKTIRRLNDDAIAMTDQAKKVAFDDMTLADVTKWESRPEIEGLPSYEQMRQELETDLGAEALKNEIPVRRVDYLRFLRERHAQEEKHNERLHVDLGDRMGMSNTEMQTVMEQTVPRFWTGRHAVDRIELAKELIPLPKEYGIEGHAAGICEHGWAAEPSVIRLSPDTVADSRFFNLYDHENAHANDWKRSKIMSPEQRLTLLYLVNKRVGAEDRIPFGYVESIQNKDAQTQRRLRVTEYWAELVSEAIEIPAKDETEWRAKFSGIAVALGAPSPEKMLPGKEDLKIVRWYLNETDPDYLPWSAAARREQLIDVAIRGRIDVESRHALEELPPGGVRAVLATVFERSMKDEPPIRKEVMRVQDSQLGTSSGSAFAELSAASQTYGNDLLWAYLQGVLDFDTRVPTELKPAMNAFIGLLESVHSWREYRETNDRFSLRDPLQSSSLGAIKRDAKALATLLHALPKERLPELERLIHEYLAVDGGEGVDVKTPRPAQFATELSALMDPTT